MSTRMWFLTYFEKRLLGQECESDFQESLWSSKHLWRHAYYVVIYIMFWQICLPILYFTKWVTLFLFVNLSHFTLVALFFHSQLMSKADSTLNVGSRNTAGWAKYKKEAEQLLKWGMIKISLYNTTHLTWMFSESSWINSRHLS